MCDSFLAFSDNFEIGLLGMKSMNMGMGVEIPIKIKH